MAKGGQYERELAVQISLWWSNGRSEELFWRSSNSGGRATMRQRRGKSSQVHGSDIAPTTSDGEPLIKFVGPEAKRGYNRSAMMADLLDRNKWPADEKARKGTMLGMIEQAMAAAKRSGSQYWALIHRRDKREALIYAPYRMYSVLGIDLKLDVDQSAMMNVVLNADKPYRKWKVIAVGVMRFDVFLKYAHPADVKRLAKHYGKKGNES